MKFITINPFDIPDAFAGLLTQVIADPGAFLPRIRHSESDYEPLHVWQARAVISMFQPVEASDGSAPARVDEASVNYGEPPRTGVSEFRALLESAKGVTADQLELQLARGHLREACRAFEVLKADRDAWHQAALTTQAFPMTEVINGPSEWINKQVAAILQLTETKERLNDLEREAAKARRVIVGNTDIENSGSLLDMLNAVLEQLKQAVLTANTDRNERQEYAQRLQGVINERDEAREAYLRTNPELVGNPAQDALAGLVAIIDKAGLLNLSNGVELGPTVWFIKANDALEFARTQLPKCSQCGKPCVPCSENGNSTTLCVDCFPF